jgi:serine/threonine protein kinase
MHPPSACADQQGATGVCARCGRAQPDDAPEGLCPACLMGLAGELAFPVGVGDTSRNGDSDEDHDHRPGATKPWGGTQHAGSFDSTLDAGRYVNRVPHKEGGIGEVFTATDTELHRTVALKRLQDKEANNPESQRRFLLEAEITAGLDHPGVVPVHSLFRDEHGRHCYTMRFIAGKSLDDAVAAYHAGPPDPVAFRRLVQSFIQLCQTIAYAHSRGVIHRDLKPKNVMIGKFGETIVIDWGLAKIVGRTVADAFADPEATLRPVRAADLQETAMGTTIGTLPYMSPEQAVGRWDVISPATDIYGLGAVLFAILTGKAPIDGKNLPEFQQKIQRGDFPRPRTLNPTVPKPLEAICLKAMALKPEDRYASARELANDIELWLADEPVPPYPEPVAVRFRRWARRHKVVVASVLSGSTIAFLIVAVSAWQIRIERAKTATEQTLRIQINSQHVRNDQQLNKASAQLGEFHGRQEALRLVRFGDHEKAFARADELWNKSQAGPKITGEDEQREAELAYDLARVCALCAAAADDGALAKQYADRGIAFLVQARNAKGFRESSKDPDFSALRVRGDFGELLNQVHPWDQ